MSLMHALIGAAGIPSQAPGSGYDLTINAIPNRVVWYKLGETSPTAVVRDSEFNGPDGSIVGGVTLGQLGLMLDPDSTDALFNGSTGYIRIPDDPVFDLPVGTLAIWFRADSLAAEFGIIGKQTQGVNAVGDFLAFYEPLNDRLRVIFDTATESRQINIAGGIQANAAHCLVVRWGDDQSPTLGFDGWLKTGGALVYLGAQELGYPGSLGAAADITIGREYTNTAGFNFPGTIGDLIIWNRRLTDDEVELVAQAEVPGGGDQPSPSEESPPEGGSPSEASPPDTIPPGSYEPIVTLRTPAVYLKFFETSGTTFSDASGNNRHGTLSGSATLGAASIVNGVGTSNRALNLGGTGSVTVAHASADTAITTNFASPWLGNHANNRFVADCTVSIWFRPNALPGGSTKAVIVSKSSSDTPGTAASFDGSFEAYFDNDGAVHVEVRSFRGRYARIRTPDGAVTTSTTYHLVVQLSYDGVAAWLDGAKFEDGYANALHLFGLAADILGVTHANTNSWMIGAAAWGGNANIIVDEFALYLRDLTQNDVEALALQEDVDPLEHPIWGASQASVSNGSVATLNSAISTRSAAGGGTVLVSGGPYTGDVILQDNVRIKTTGSVTVNGSIRTPVLNPTTLSGGSTLANGSRVLTIPNTIAAGDLVVVKGNSASTTRYDRDFNSLAQSQNPTITDGQLLEVESRTSAAITFVGTGWNYASITPGDRTVYAVTPTKNVAVEGDFHVFNSQTAALLGAIGPRYVTNARFIGCTGERTASGVQEGQFVSGRPWCYGVQFRNVFGRTASNNLNNNLDGIQWGASSHCVSIDCDTFQGRHACDLTGWGGSGHGAIPSNYCEHHGLSWNNTASGGGKASAFGAHGINKDCIIWNGTSNWGGPNFCGIRQDQRWIVTGNNQGEISSNDGSFGCYVRDIRIISASNWFRRSGGPTRVAQCHFENITRQSGSGSGEDHNLVYGTGADVNTYSNVTEPSGQWQQV